jgi:hypothetical protein
MHDHDVLKLRPEYKNPEPICLLCHNAAIETADENTLVAANLKVALYANGQLLYFSWFNFCLMNGKKQDFCPISL